MKKVLSSILVGAMLISSIGAISAFAVEPKTETSVTKKEVKSSFWQKNKNMILKVATSVGVISIPILLYAVHHFTSTPTLDEKCSRSAIKELKSFCNSFLSKDKAIADAENAYKSKRELVVSALNGFKGGNVTLTEYQTAKNQLTEAQNNYDALVKTTWEKCSSDHFTTFKEACKQAADLGMREDCGYGGECAYSFYRW